MDRSSHFGRKGCWLTAAVLLILGGGLAGAQTSSRYSLGIQGTYTPAGMLIGAVVPGSAADRAGLRRGDLVLTMNNQQIQNQQDFGSVLDASGGQVVLSVRQGATGQIGRLTVALTRTGQGIHAPYMLGILGQYTPQGMLIQTVGPNMPASRIGLQPGDLIVRINKKFIANQADFFNVMDNSGGTLTLTVRKGQTGQVMDLRVHLRVYQLGVLGDFTPQGMVVGLVVPETPAARLGLQQGDLIARIDGKTVTNQNDFAAALANSGGSVMLVVRRPPTYAAAQLKADLLNNPLGCWCLPGQDGMRITSVAGGTPADRAGLGRGDVILRVDGQRVQTLRELTHAVEQANGTTTLQVRDAQTERVGNVDVDLTK